MKLVANFIVSLSLLNPIISNGQNWSEVWSYELESSVSSFDFDQSSFLYVGQENGSILKIGTDGEVVASFEPPNQRSITAVSASNPLSVLLFYLDTQEYIYLDRFLSNPVSYSLAEISNDYVWLLANAEDENLWLLERNPNQIRKWNEQLRKTIFSLPIQNGFLDNITYFRSRKGNFYLLNAENEVWVLDYFGNISSKSTWESKNR